jgi:hypothetical protein
LKYRKVLSGQFSKQEMELLKQGICEYCKENNLGVKELAGLIEETAKNSGYSKAWIKISEILRKWL